MRNLHIYPSLLTHESRILRITKTLADARIFKEIIIIGIAGNNLPAFEQLDSVRTFRRVRGIPLEGHRGLLAKALRLSHWSVSVLRSIKDTSVDCVNAHSLSVLPLCLVISFWKGARLIYDTHELETETSGSGGVRRILARLVERVCIRYCRLLFVVSASIADWYQQQYSASQPIVIRNIPDDPSNPGDSGIDLRAATSASDASVIFLFLGGLIEGRSIARLLEVFEQCSDQVLVFQGEGRLAGLVDSYAQRCPNIFRMKPVPPAQVIGSAKSADVGICLTEPVCLSHEFSLPNKFFEYLFAGLPVLASRLIELERVVQAFGCGWLASSSTDGLTTLVKSLRREEITSKQAAVRDATRTFSWQNEAERLLTAYRLMLDEK